MPNGAYLPYRGRSHEGNRRKAAGAWRVNSASMRPHQVFSLPMHAYLTDEAQDRISAAVLAGAGAA